MLVQGKIQKWGNSSAVRLSAKALASAGIEPESEIDIQTSKGRIVIQLQERSKEQLFDKLLAEIPDAKTILAGARKAFSSAIKTTDETTKGVETLCADLENKKLGVTNGVGS